jgi:hypothetical protein
LGVVSVTDEMATRVAMWIDALWRSPKQLDKAAVVVSRALQASGALLGAAVVKEMLEGALLDLTVGHLVEEGWRVLEVRRNAGDCDGS